MFYWNRATHFVQALSKSGFNSKAECLQETLHGTLIIWPHLETVSVKYLK